MTIDKWRIAIYNRSINKEQIMNAITTVEAEAIQPKDGSLAANPKVTPVQDRGEEDEYYWKWLENTEYYWQPGF